VLNGVDALSAALRFSRLPASAAAKRPPPWQLKFSTSARLSSCALHSNLLGPSKDVRCAHQWTALYGDKRFQNEKCDYFML